MTYTPTVNDYVKWTTALGMVHEGWVYYKSTPLDNVFRKKNGWREIDPYNSIEVATKPRPQCDISTFLHKRIHFCLCCPESCWHELEFIRRRISKHDDTDPDKISFGMYKSQQYRPLDSQQYRADTEKPLFYIIKWFFKYKSVFYIVW